MWAQPLGWEDPLEKEMATHSNILAWRIPGTEEPGGLQSIGLQRVRHDWNDLASKHIIYDILYIIFITYLSINPLMFS